MTGLDAILTEIASDAEAIAKHQLDETQAKVDKVLSDAREAAAQQTQEILKQGEARGNEIRERAHSAAQLETRSRTLAFKQQLIREMILDTRTALENASENEYFSVVLKLVKKYALADKGEMHFNAKDLGRLPANFEQSVAALVPGGAITISQEPSKISSGFLLTYGGIDINCTFEAIFEDASDALCDAVGHILFQNA